MYGSAKLLVSIIIQLSLFYCSFIFLRNFIFCPRNLRVCCFDRSSRKIRTLLFKVEENVPWGEDTLFTLEFRNFAHTGSCTVPQKLANKYLVLTIMGEVFEIILKTKNYLRFLNKLLALFPQDMYRTDTAPNRTSFLS